MLTILNAMLEFFKQIHICLLCCVENKDDKNHKPSFFPNSMYSNHFCRIFSRLYFTGLCNVYIDSFTESEKETVSEQFIHETNKNGNTDPTNTDGGKEDNSRQFNIGEKLSLKKKKIQKKKEWQTKLIHKSRNNSN